MRRFQGSRYAAMLGLAGAAALTACGGGSDGHHANAGHSRGGRVGHRRHGGQGPDGQGQIGRAHV